MNKYGYDPDASYGGDNDYSPVPPGKYNLQVQSMEERTTKSGGLALSMTAQIIGGQGHAGRKIWHSFNVKNNSPKAVEIGMQQLHRLVVASGVNKNWQGLHEFNGKVFVADLEVEQREGFSARNVIKRFSKYEGNAGAPPSSLPPDFSVPF
tara:strand:- start:867 stop:1319 length:453 start_codon:yes stop_codon:yes gene_type:complete